MEIEIPYHPRDWAVSFHNSAKRWLIIVAHRRSGKTTASLNHLQRDAIRTPQSRFAYVAPTYKLAKNVAWDIIKHYSNVVPGREYNESELSVKYPNGSKITLYGSDNPDALRGMGLWGVVFDEYSQQPSNIFSEIIRPALSDHNGYAIWIGTPKGKNDFWRLYEKAKSDNDWFSMLLRASESTILSEQELADARKTMSENEYNQEFECSFEASIKGAYYATQLAEARKRSRIRLVPYDKSLKVFLVWDLGVGQALGIGFYQKSGNETRMIDYWEGSNQDGIPQAIKALQNKPYVYGTFFLPHDAEATSIDTGKSRVQTLRDLWPNISINIVPKVAVDDGIEKGKLFWSHLWVDEENCQTWLDYMGQYKQEWDDNRGMFRETPYHDFTSHCFSGDTQVLTHNGICPIMELSGKGKILTLLGWKNYQNPRITIKNAELVEVSFQDGMKVKCTPEHLFLTENGWELAKDLTKNSKIQSSLTLSRSILMVAYLSNGLVRDILQEVAKDFIGKFGNMLLAKYLKDVISTIKTVMVQIISFATLNVCLPTIIYLKRGLETNKTSKSILLTKPEMRLQNGIVQKKEDYGIAGWPERVNRGLNGNEKKENVYSAGRYFGELLKIVDIIKNTVIQIVKPLTIEGVKYLSNREDVWDLTVPGYEHFSLANGAIVHNSADIHRYAALIEDRMRDDDYGSLPRSEIKAQDLDPYRPERTFNDNIGFEENIL